MFCPACGAGNQTAKSFCKQCGQWLPDLTLRPRAAFGGETPQQNIFTGLFMNVLSTLAALFSAIALYVTYLGSRDAKWSVYLAAAFCLCIAGWQTSSFMVGLKLRQRLKRGREGFAEQSELSTNAETPALSAGDMNSMLDIPGVTEETTRTLEANRVRNRDTQK